MYSTVVFIYRQHFILERFSLKVTETKVPRKQKHTTGRTLCDLAILPSYIVLSDIIILKNYSSILRNSDYIRV
jgi:hypothetical protein